jgi:hypothetical protein
VGEAARKLTSFIDRADRYDIPHAEVAQLQLDAARELFEERKSQIKFLAHRAEEAGVVEVRGIEDLVGLLFAHTTYKSYPEKWLTDEKWALLGKWVDNMSTHRVQDIDLSEIKDIDDWIGRMGAAGHYLACSSGTTGKSAILNASEADMEWARRNIVSSITWSASLAPNQQFLQFSAAAVATTPRNVITSEAMASAFARQDREPFASPVPAITLGQMTAMVALRKRIADGVARPEEITEYEATSAKRASLMEVAIPKTAEAMIAARGERIMLSGMWGHLYKLAEFVRGHGYGKDDFHPENAIFSAGGLKGSVLPENYREYVFETFNINPKHVAQAYSMQEIQTSMPLCKAGRYHLPPWLIPLILDEGGDNLIEIPDTGEAEGRAGFFDLSIDGRWNGVISGDKVSITYDKCACGSGSPSIRDNITRYADLAGGDKITCAGTADAYVRGIS